MNDEELRKGDYLARHAVLKRTGDWKGFEPATHQRAFIALFALLASWTRGTNRALHMAGKSMIWK